MSQDDQRYALMAAAAAATYAKKKARDEARRALLLSQALSQNMSLDPKTQQDLQRLLQEETKRVGQENFEWQLGWTILTIIVGGFALLLFLGGIATCSHSDASDSAYNVATPQATAMSERTPIPEATPTPIQVRRAEAVEVRRATSVILAQAERELQKAWDSLPLSKREALRAEERAWWHKKDQATGAAKIQMIQERTAYLLNQS